MSEVSSQHDVTAEIGKALPYLRRYARALTGAQSSGDRYAAAALEAILEDRSMLDDVAPKIGLFRAFNKIWRSSGAPIEDSANDLEAKAQEHLAKLTTNTREALLLHTVEEFSFEESAQIMEVSAEEAAELVQIARNEMSKSASGRLMIIEDEALISVDLKAIANSMGHEVTGIARTHAQATELAAKDRPELILADIHLADNSSGIEAVNEIIKDMGEIPVVFITAYPERLLTGEKHEPAFLISKPYTEDQVRSAISQAMFFSSTETLRA
ncbi:response regulator receiver protein [Litoreibacter ponti]|uniref:Response regulator receiver protein n=1 Tax=Litoreibacter ponti TaxID=1510457 RepID=A0A2T6BJ99_9RHOB|nr:response regulator [Litoreibacter ponti]PTX56141.1 response regulator receiver protein [Litoreibacter ponti]